MIGHINNNNANTDGTRHNASLLVTTIATMTHLTVTPSCDQHFTVSVTTMGTPAAATSLVTSNAGSVGTQKPRSSS